MYRYQVRFYEDERGKKPIADYIKELAGKKDKDSRIKLNKIRDYIKVLRTEGTSAGKPYIKHLEGDIWELRPLRDRILFAAWDGKNFLLLHNFVKKTQKTPPGEIKKAKNKLADWKERSIEDDE